MNISTIRLTVQTTQSYRCFCRFILPVSIRTKYYCYFSQFAKMKKSFLTLFLISTISAALFAQHQDSTSWAYAELLGYKKFLSQKVLVEIDFGQASKFFQNDLIVDENGKAITFNSMVDAMNYMGKFNWEFVQAYIVTEGNQNVYHWLMKRAVKLDEKGGYIPLTHKEYKNAKAKF